MSARMTHMPIGSCVHHGDPLASHTSAVFVPVLSSAKAFRSGERCAKVGHQQSSSLSCRQRESSGYKLPSIVCSAGNGRASGHVNGSVNGHGNGYASVDMTAIVNRHTSSTAKPEAPATVNGHSSSDSKLAGSANVQKLDQRDAEDVSQEVNFSSLVSAEINSNTDEFFASDTDGDPDCPTHGFASIIEAVEAIRQGKFVVVVDDEDRENEGDLIMAASLVTPEDMAFMVRYCTGIVCVGMTGAVLDQLNLPLMVRNEENEEAMYTAFTVSVDAAVGTTTGVSAADRAKTVVALASPDSTADHFKRPGHIFPLRARDGGVLKRAGHTEAAVDLADMAGLPPAGVLCEIVNDADGSMSRYSDLMEFAKKHNLPIISIADLIRYRRKRSKLVERTAVARLPTQWGLFKAYSYTSQLDGIEHIAMVKGDIGDGMGVLVRVHSECLTGDIFGSARCDCGPQLAQAMQNIEKEGRGVLVYLRGHEGRGIGLGHKLQAYNLQDEGRDTVEANVDLGLPVDSREYGIGAQILKDVGVRTMKLMTNNPTKYLGLKGYGLTVSHRVPICSPHTKENMRYLETKRSKMGHVYGAITPGLTPILSLDRLVNPEKVDN